MDNESIKKAFSGTVYCEDGGVVHIRAMASPDDFIAEALRNRQKRDKLLYKAHKRVDKYGIDDERARRFFFDAEICGHAMSEYEQIALTMKECDERRKGRGER